MADEILNLGEKRPAAATVKVSFEFFPPKTAAMAKTLAHSVKTLATLDPVFVSVTCGAGGSDSHHTFDTLRSIEQQAATVPTAAHLTCVGAAKTEIDALVEQYYAAGIRHIVALRGDPPAEKQDVPGYRSAHELVEAIRRIAPMEISVAAYPEVHPLAASAHADMENLKRKVEAGATRAISQFFFDPDNFLRFRDRASQAGIEAPIVPGIMPINDFGRIKQFADSCGAVIPPWLEKIFSGCDADPLLNQLTGAAVALRLCNYLQQHGVEQFHFYTLNRMESSYWIGQLLTGQIPNFEQIGGMMDNGY